MRRVSKPRKGKRTTIDGYTFDSLLEAKRYGELCQLRAAGELYDLVVHPRFDLEVNGRKIGRGYITLDFSYFDFRRDRMVYEDVKAVDTRESKLRRELCSAIHDITIDLIGGG